MSDLEITPTIPESFRIIERFAEQQVQENLGKTPQYILEGLGSRELLSTANQIGQLNCNSQQTFILEADDLLSRLSGVTEDLTTQAAAQIDTTKESLSKLQNSRNANASVFTMVQQEFGSAIGIIAEEIAKDERKLYSSIALDALESLGYQTQLEEGETASAILATRGHEVRVLGIDKDLNLERDGAGLTGDDCHEADARIVEELAKRGLKLGKARKSRHHGNAKGGDMLRELARDRSHNLAASYVKSKDSSGKSGPKATHNNRHKNNQQMKEAN